MRGFTLVETVVGAAVFLIVATASYSAYVSLFRLVDLNQTRTLAIELADEQFEVIRNMPYANIGIVNGIPAGTLPQEENFTRGGMIFTVDRTVRNIDLPFDGTASNPSNPDNNPADNKLVEISVSCASCQNFQPLVLTSQIAPKNLETTNPNNGSLIIKVANSNGVPVSGASVYIVNVATTTPIIVNDITDNNGNLQVYDLPAGSNAYSVIVTKNGYSTDKTYAPNDPNAPPGAKSYATVFPEQVTAMTFVIDQLSAINIWSYSSDTCSPLGNFNLNMAGAKNSPKYSQNLATNGAGTLYVGNLVPDDYTISSIDGSHDLIGVNPLNPISVASPNTATATLILADANPETVLVSVRDMATGEPLPSATVEIINQANNSNNTKKTSMDMTSACATPGQVSFSGLSSGNYQIMVLKSGYISFSSTMIVNSNWSEIDVHLMKII